MAGAWLSEKIDARNPGSPNRQRLRLPTRTWQRISAGQGAKGHRYDDWAFVTLPLAADEHQGHHWLLDHPRHRRTRLPRRPHRTLKQIPCWSISTAMAALEAVRLQHYRLGVVPGEPLPPPTAEQLESWAGRGRVLRATETDVAAWRLPQSAKTALTISGVPLFDGLVREVSFRAAPTMYRLAVDYDDGPVQMVWEYGAVPETGEVRLWLAGEHGDGSFVNSSISQWLCSLHLVGCWFTESAATDLEWSG
ncbi:SUKH-4 family immunity protein [Micromonospora zhanjiangensis]